MSMAERMRKVYGTEGDHYDVLEPKGLAEYVEVDVEIPGCPIEKKEILRAITSILHGDMPELIDYPVCVECKLKGYLCVLVERGMPCLGPIITAGCEARGMPCLGPIITAGCEARCPGLGLDCIGCRGPIKDETNATAELDVLLEKGYDENYIFNHLRFFGGNFEDIVKLTERISGNSENTEERHA